jgi:hypothetical protein
MGSHLRRQDTGGPERSSTLPAVRVVALARTVMYDGRE